VTWRPDPPATAAVGRQRASPNKCILTSNKLEERKREMELRRRKKEEEKVSTENKIKEVKVSDSEKSSAKLS